MNRALEEQFLFVDGEPVLSLAEFQQYAYGIAEDAVAPKLLTQWAGGAEVGLDQLLECLRGEATQAVSSNDGSLEVLRSALERLERLFPEAARGN
jgi:hypothetical protein